MYLNSGHASIGTQHRISERCHSFLLKFKYHDSLMSVCPPNVAFEYELSVCQLKFIGWIIIQNLFKVGPCRRITFTSCSHVLFTLRLAWEGVEEWSERWLLCLCRTVKRKPLVALTLDQGCGLQATVFLSANQKMRSLCFCWMACFWSGRLVLLC